MDSFKVGDMIKVQFNIKGSKWERDGQTNYISNLDAWRVEQIGMPAAAPPAGMPGTAPGFGPAPAADAADDLPF